MVMLDRRKDRHAHEVFWESPGLTDTASEATVIASGRKSRCAVHTHLSFRRRAVELARMREKPVAQIARDLGISDSCLRGWMKQADLDEGRRADGLTTAERDELVQLRRELRVAKTACGLLDVSRGVYTSTEPTTVGPSDPQRLACRRDHRRQRRFAGHFRGAAGACRAAAGGGIVVGHNQVGRLMRMAASWAYR
jgi:hypothetical protein